MSFRTRQLSRGLVLAAAVPCLLVFCCATQAVAQQLPCVTRGNSPQPMVGAGSVAPSLNPSYTPPTPDSRPPCLPMEAAPPDAPSPAMATAENRARQAQLLKLQKQLESDTAQLVALAQKLQGEAGVQENRAVLSATAVQEANQIQKLAKQIASLLKRERS